MAQYVERKKGLGVFGVGWGGDMLLQGNIYAEWTSTL